MNFRSTTASAWRSDRLDCFAGPHFGICGQSLQRAIMSMALPALPCNLLRSLLLALGESCDKSGVQVGKLLRQHFLAFTCIVRVALAHYFSTV